MKVLTPLKNSRPLHTYKSAKKTSQFKALSTSGQIFMATRLFISTRIVKISFITLTRYNINERSYLQLQQHEGILDVHENEANVHDDETKDKNLFYI